MRRDSATHEQIRQDQQHVLRADPSSHYRGQPLARIRVENIENPKGPAVVRPIRHEVLRPDVMALCGPPPQARPLGAPKSGSLRLLRGHVEAFVPPHCVHALFAHVPALTPQAIRHGSVAIPPVLLGQCDDPLAHLLSKQIGPWHVPRRGPDLADRPTRPALRHLEHGDGVPHGLALAGRAQKFPEATSLRIERSSAWSATIRLSRSRSDACLIDALPAVILSSSSTVRRCSRVVGFLWACTVSRAWPVTSLIAVQSVINTRPDRPG